MEIRGDGEKNDFIFFSYTQFFSSFPFIIYDLTIFFFSSLIFVYFCFDLLYTRFWSISSHFVRLLLPCFVSISFIMFISVGSGGGWRVDSGTRKTRKKQRKAN